jgi:hypothetical protein
VGLLGRMGVADPEESAAVTVQARAILEKWGELQIPTMLYDAVTAGHQFRGLLRDFTGAPRSGVWATMRSVRNVDEEIPLRPIGWS